MSNIDENETVEFGEVHVFAGPEFVITVRHSETPSLASVRHDLEARPDLLQRGPVAVLHAIMDRVVDDYGPVIAGVGGYVVRGRLFNCPRPAAAQPPRPPVQIASVAPQNAYQSRPPRGSGAC